MCRQCHSQLSDETILTQLTEALKNPEYEKWNTTSLSHICIAIEGANGKEAHDLGVQLAEGFYTWFLGSTNGVWESLYRYQPATGLEPFPHSSEIRKMIDDAKALYEKDYPSDCPEEEKAEELEPIPEVDEESEESDESDESDESEESEESEEFEDSE